MLGMACVRAKTRIDSFTSRVLVVVEFDRVRTSLNRSGTKLLAEQWWYAVHGFTIPELLR